MSLNQKALGVVLASIAVIATTVTLYIGFKILETDVFSEEYLEGVREREERNLYELQDSAFY